MKRSLLVATFVALLLPLGASAKPPAAAHGIPQAPWLSAPAHVFEGPHLAVTNVSSSGMRPGGTYVLRGSVLNDGTAAARARVSVHLVRVGLRPIAIGATPIRLRAHHARPYAVRVHVPRVLQRGSYAVVACARLGCATAERHLQVGSPTRPRLLAQAAAPARCSSGSHTLSAYGMHVYPETGNGGYRSVHSDVYLSYDAENNLFLPGTKVVLAQVATQCLTDFSLDFERSSANTKDGPDLQVGAVFVNGKPAKFAFVQPAYPGDPNGQNDPDPRAHQAGELNPVGGPENNPLPPACTPELLTTNPGKETSLDGTPCPANKLVITPAAPIASGASFAVEVDYTGRPGVHNDGDGTTEGWFRVSGPSDTGGFVTTEPVATMDWMPLNDHPSVKPTYDVYDTVAVGKTAIANGELVSRTPNLPDANFPGGSVTWHWHSPEGVSSYLVENSIGSYDLTTRLASSGIQYYEAQDVAVPSGQATKNQGIMDQQESVLNFQTQFNGPFPFTTDGVIVGIPNAGFEEEMQTKITFANATIDLLTLHHENFHQWWGDNVAEAHYNLTFFKEGLATLGEFLFIASGSGPAGSAGFEQSLVDQFNSYYDGKSDLLWTGAPSDPRPANLFSGSKTYVRPGIAYIALRRTLGPANFTAALQDIQGTYGGSSITEPQLVTAFTAHLPTQTTACKAQLAQFFTQWWDTVYPPGGGANRPDITAPGLSGGGFHC